MTPYADLIAAYERHELDRAAPPVVDPATVLDGLTFARVRELSAFWRADGAGDYPRRAADLAVSAHAYGAWFVFVLTGTAEEVQLYVALDDMGTVTRLLQSAYPGVHCAPLGHTALGSDLRPRFAFSGMVSGVPLARYDAMGQGPPDQDETAHLARVIRGMRGAEWAFVVRAFPRPAGQVHSSREQLLDHLVQVLPATRQNVQRTFQETIPRTDSRSQSISEVLGGEIVNRQAEYAADLLNRELVRLDETLALGQWQVAVHYGATDGAAARRLGGLLRGVFSGPGVHPDRIRATESRASGRTTDERLFHTLLTSREVGSLIELPREEVPGYRLRDFAPFSTDLAPGLAGGRRSVSLGRILRDGSPAGSSFALPLDDLSKHAFVAGVTGSGKTTTIRGLVSSLDRAGVPFLIIEPAKTEYRALLGQVRHGIASGPLPHLRIYTLGNDQVAPFRINPFEFETDDDPGGSLLLSHIDLFKAVFNAAFVLYAPMPYVLETALHEVYEDKGWNLATGQNSRLPARQWSQRDQFAIFPTLADLYRKVEAVTRRLGYEARIEQDVTAGLKARIGSLRIGSKGLMLDVARGKPMTELLGEAAVLELENIGNDSEKAFIIGLVLVRLYELRRLQAARGTVPKGLRHLLVVEEAHRLLRNVGVDVDAESSNLRAQAVETFVNMLSEVRRYGKGVLVADQVPSKLSPDVIKNSNLKVIHRLVAEDDRHLLAGSTNMSQAQAQHLATLPVGRAAVSAEGADHPYLVAVDDVLAGRGVVEPLDREVAAAAAAYINLGRCLSVPDLARFGIPVGAFDAPDPVLCQRALEFVTVEQEPAAWARIITRAIYARPHLAGELDDLERRFSVASPQLPGGQVSSALRLVIAFGAERALSERAAEYGWAYPLVDTLREALTSGLLQSLRTPGSREATAALDRFARLYETQTERKHGPYPGCASCPSICRFRADVRRMLTRDTARAITVKLIDPGPRSTLQRYTDTAELLRTTTSRWVGTPMHGADALSYCCALTACSGLDSYQQAEVAAQLAPHLL